jgi:hypothetical protein
MRGYANSSLQHTGHTEQRIGNYGKKVVDGSVRGGESSEELVAAYVTATAQPPSVALAPVGLF